MSNNQGSSSNNSNNSNQSSSQQDDSPLSPKSALKDKYSTKGKLVTAIIAAGGGGGLNAKDLGKANTRSALDTMGIALGLHGGPAQAAAGGAALAAAAQVVVTPAVAAAVSPIAPKTSMAPPPARQPKGRRKKKAAPGAKFASQAAANAAAVGGGGTVTRTFVTGAAGGAGGGGAGGKKGRRKVKTKKRWKKGEKPFSYLKRGTYAVPKGASAATKSFVQKMRTKKSTFPTMKPSAAVQLVGPRALPSNTSWSIPIAQAHPSAAVAAPLVTHPHFQPQSMASYALGLQAQPQAVAAAAVAAAHHAVPMEGVTSSPPQVGPEMLTIPVTNTTAGNVVIRGSYMPPSTPNLRYGDTNTYKLCTDVASGLDHPLGPGMTFPVRVPMGTSVVLVGYPAGDLQTVLELPPVAAADGSVTAVQWTGTTMGVSKTPVSIRGSKRARSPSPPPASAKSKGKRRKKGGRRRKSRVRRKRRTKRRRRSSRRRRSRRRRRSSRRRR